jgi:hypothetical protein
MELQALRLRRGALRDKAQGGDVHGALTELCTELWGSILMFQTILAVSPIRKAVVADRHNYTEDGAERDFPFLFGTSDFLPIRRR